MESRQPRVFSPALHRRAFFPLPVARQYVRIIPVSDPAEERWGVIVFIQDLSAQIDYEQEINSRYRALVDASVDHLFLLDTDGRCLTSNERVEHFGIENGSRRPPGRRGGP